MSDPAHIAQMFYDGSTAQIIGVGLTVFCLGLMVLVIFRPPRI